LAPINGPPGGALRFVLPPDRDMTGKPPQANGLQIKVRLRFARHY